MSARTFVVSLLASGFLIAAAASTAAAAPEVVTVDVGARVKAVDHAASGSL